MRVINCKRYDTDEKYEMPMIKDWKLRPNDTCKVLCTSFVNSTEKVCANEYCKYVKPANLK